MLRSRAIAVTIAVTFLLGVVTPASAVTQSDVSSRRQAAENARAKAAAADKRASALAKEASAIDGRIDSLQADVDELEPQIDAAVARVARLRREVGRLRSDIASKQGEIDATTLELARQQALLGDRVTSAYKQGSWYYLQLLLTSEGLSDFIARTELVGRVIVSNEELAGTLESTRGSLEKQRASLDRSLTDVNAKRLEAETISKNLKHLQEARQERVDEQQTLFDEKSSMMAESKANAARYRKFAAEEEAEADRIASELSSRRHGSGKVGAMTFPVPSGSISSGFGWRIHPIFHDRRFHKGVDISAASGAVVVAATAGTVIRAESGWGGGYGNRVWIDHGNGVVTTYNHLKSFSVSEGDHVSAGQTIAHVGSTGYSTGPHLHFEVWVNGEPRDPQDYL